MKYRVHRLEVKKDTAQETLEQFLNRLEGEVLSIVPYIIPTLQGMGAIMTSFDFAAKGV
jgi:hypothetical protein